MHSKARQIAHWVILQIQANSRGDREGRLLPVPVELQWYLPPGGNITPLKGVTVRPLPTSTLGVQMMEQS